MSSKIDFSSLTDRVPEQVMNFADLIKEKSFEYGNFTDLLTLVDDIDYQKKIGFIGEMPDIGVKANTAACTLNTRTVEIPTSEEEWLPKKFDTRLFFCADDLNDTVAQIIINKGIRRYDIT